MIERENVPCADDLSTLPVASNFAPEDRGALAREVEDMARELAEQGDLYRLQRRCDRLLKAVWPDARNRASLEWIAAEAELIDCRLVSDSKEALAAALRLLGRQIRST